MKKILALLLAAMLCFAGCGKTIEGTVGDSSSSGNGSSASDADSTSSGGSGSGSSGDTLFTIDNYPKMDGSTANLPMMAQIMSATCGISLEEAEALTTCRKTPAAWEAITSGESDILLVYEAAEETKKLIEESGTELLITPIGRDGLVFINSSKNEVDDLSQQQLLDIYTGKIKNWKDVGGKDIEIIPFQRPSASGSQSLFMKLLMKDIKPMEAPTELTPAGMGDLIDSIAVYDNTENALGYSVFYYASYMYTKPNLRLMKVDGVAPSDETIGNGKYPLINEYYLVIRKDEAEDSPARKLYNWILSEQGRENIVEAGYVPMPK